MKGNDFDKIIGEKLDGYREEPSPGLFPRIEKSLGDVAKKTATTERGRRTPFFYAVRIGAAAAILAGIVLGYTMLKNNGAESVNNQTIAVTIPDSVREEKSATVVEVTTEEPSVPVIREDLAKESISVTEKLREAVENDMRTAYREQEGGAGKVLADAGKTGQEDKGTGTFTKEIPELKIPDMPQYDDTEKAPDNNLVQPIDMYWEELLREETAPKRKTGRTSGSLYAGNLGTGTGDYVSSDMKDLITSRMTIMETSGVNYDESTVLHSPGNAQANPAAVPDTQAELTHKMPVNFGLTVGIPISDKLAIISGLNYSYLHSVSSQSSRSNSTNTLSREVHYVGIPLGLSYSFYNTKRIGMYVSGGAMLEKAVYAREVTTFSFDSGDTRKSQRINVKGVSPSVRASLGISFRLASGVTLYVEPGVAYYFEQVNALQSYRTEYPVNFSLTAGIRFGI